jgi:NAD(P)-dependent dehydrogenase (short-subunit alcohol dehydrogenase family)
MSRLQNKVAVITGGTSGIGPAAAQRFIAEGAFVYIFARRQRELDKTVASIGRNIAGVQGDLRKLEDLDRLYAKVGEEKASSTSSSLAPASSTLSRLPRPRKRASTRSLRSTQGDWLLR